MSVRTNAVAGGGGAEFITGTLSAKASEAVVIPCPKEPYLVVCRFFKEYSSTLFAMAACGGFENGVSTTRMGVRQYQAVDKSETFTPSATYSDGYITISAMHDNTQSWTWNYYIVY